VGKHQVGRLDVTVHDAPGMGVIEGFADIGPDLGDLAIAEEPPVYQAPDRVTLDQLADQEGPPSLGSELVVSELEKRDDARMVEPRGRFCLAADPRTTAPVGFDDLDGHVPLEAPIPGPIDRAEASTAEAVFDLEPAEYSGADHPYPGNSPQKALNLRVGGDSQLGGWSDPGRRKGIDWPRRMCFRWPNYGFS